MWEIPQDKLTIDLPPGFRLMEDEDTTHLFYGDEQVAFFSSTGVDPKEIERAAEEHLKSRIRK